MVNHAVSGTIKRRLAPLAVFALAGLILAACGSSGSTGATATTNGASTTGAVKGGTLTIVGSGDVDFFDTAAAYYDVTYILFRAVTRQLYVVPTKPLTSDQVNPVPDLATAMPTITNGGKTYTLVLRKGLTYSDGAPVGAEGLHSRFMPSTSSAAVTWRGGVVSHMAPWRMWMV